MIRVTQCHIMLHCVTLCHTMLYCVTLCYTCVTLCYTMLHLCYIVLHYVTLCYTTLHCVTLCYTTLHCVTLCYIVLHYVTLCYTMLHCVTLCDTVFLGLFSAVYPFYSILLSVNDVFDDLFGSFCRTRWSEASEPMRISSAAGAGCTRPLHGVLPFDLGGAGSEERIVGRLHFTGTGEFQDDFGPGGAGITCGDEAEL